MGGEWQGIFVAANLLVIIGFLIFSRVSPWVLFSMSALALYVTDVLSLQTLTTGFTNPSLLALVLLYLVSLPLERTTLMRRVTVAVTEGSVRTMTLKLGVFAGALSAVVNNTAVVAAMLGPLKNQMRVAPSKLLLPLSYVSILGGTVTLIGTSTNLIVDGFVRQAGYPALSFFDFTWVGLPVFIVCLGVMVLLAPRLLPDHSVAQDKDTGKDYFLERRVKPGSPLVGRTVLENGLRQLERVFLIEVIRDQQVLAPVGPHERLQENDILVFTGDLSGMGIVDSFPGVELMDVVDDKVRENLIEVIISPSSTLAGRTIKEVDFRARFDAAVVAVRRGDQRLRGGLGNLELRAGDALVLAVGEDFGGRQQSLRADFLVIGGVASTRLLDRRHGFGVIGGFVAVVVLSALGVVSLLKGLLVLMGLLLLVRVVTLEEIKARFPYDLVIVIGGALGLSQAMIDTGLAGSIGHWAGIFLGDGGMIGALVGVFFLTWLMTELVTNNAAAAVIFPLAMAIAQQWPDSYMAFVMAVAFGASASFLSPYGYQTNLMVYTAGNYRLGDYLRFGLPILLTYSVMALVMIVAVFG